MKFYTWARTRHPRHETVMYSRADTLEDARRDVKTLPGALPGRRVRPIKITGYQITDETGKVIERVDR